PHARGRARGPLLRVGPRRARDRPDPAPRAGAGAAADRAARRPCRGAERDPGPLRARRARPPPHRGLRLPSASVRATLPFVLLLALVFPAVAFGQDKPRRDPPPLPHSPRAAEIRALIDRLGATEHADREAARARLLAIGEEAIPWLERALHDQD